MKTVGHKAAGRLDMMFERNAKNIKIFRYLKCAAECSTSLKSVCPQIIFVFIKTELGLNTGCFSTGG